MKKHFTMCSSSLDELEILEPDLLESLLRKKTYKICYSTCGLNEIFGDSTHTSPILGHIQQSLTHSSS